MMLLPLLMMLINPIYSNEYVKVIIEFDEGVDADKAISMLDRYGISIIQELKYTFNGVIAYVDYNALRALSNEPMIKAIYNDKIISIKSNSIQSNLELIGIYDDIIRYDGMNVTGKGVKVAIIDTGVDYTHEALGYDKFVGGYDFLDKDMDPRDEDGHGTMVAGIIAADGALRGVAPDASIIAYRIASGDRYVTSSEMIQAIERAVEDGADILNISIGLDHISEEIDKAVNNVVDKGVVVITAAGNDGERGFNTIKSPGSAFKAITVGATLTNTNEPYFATLKVIGHEDILFHPIPMADTVIADEPIKARLVYVGYATEDDVKDMSLNNTIALAKRGGPIDEFGNMELVYFSDKEYNVARKGALGLIVYNNEPGIFRGKLIHENNKEGYKPSIPTVSLSQEEGMLLKQLLEQEGELFVELRVFSDPNIVAEFSAKGPVSPFYMKPELVAPGVMINSTFIDNSYNLSTGTSFAAPHVSGAAALLLQLHPDLKPEEVKSLLITTADQLRDPFNIPYSFDVAGAGRLNVSKAINSRLLAMPYNAILHVSPIKNDSKVIELRALKGKLDDIVVDSKLYLFNNIPLSFNNISKLVELDYNVEVIDGSNARLYIKAHPTTQELVEGKYEGRIFIKALEQEISLPLIIFTSKVGINASNNEGLIKLAIDLNEAWETAKVTIINPENNFKRILTLTPSKNSLSIKADSIGEHWIDVAVIAEEGIINGFATLYVNDVKKDNGGLYVIDSYIPFKEAMIIIGFLAIISIIAIIIKKSRDRAKEEDRIINDFY